MVRPVWKKNIGQARLSVPWLFNSSELLDIFGSVQLLLLFFPFQKIRGNGLPPKTHSGGAASRSCLSLGAPHFILRRLPCDTLHKTRRAPLSIPPQRLQTEQPSSWQIWFLEMVGWDYKEISGLGKQRGMKVVAGAERFTAQGQLRYRLPHTWLKKRNGQQRSTQNPFLQSSLATSSRRVHFQLTVYNIKVARN